MQAVLGMRQKYEQAFVISNLDQRDTCIVLFDWV